MITAKQMKDAVHDQMADVVAQRLNLLVRFASYRLKGEHNVAENKRRPRWQIRPQPTQGEAISIAAVNFASAEFIAVRRRARPALAPRKRAQYERQAHAG